MFARVIVGVDGAYGGLDASALAGVLADPEADVVLARVAVPAGGAAGAADAADEDASFTAARRALAASLSADSTPSVSALVIDRRSIADGLHRLAEEGPADLIVVGSHHRHRTGRLWSANRTRATLRDAPCPVAVAPQGFATAPRRPIEVIGIAYDDTREARDALLFGRALASETGAEIHAVWVVERSNWTDSQSRVGRKAAEAAHLLADLHGVVGVAVEGDPRHAKDALARFARDVDLLILGSHHHGQLRRIVLGDTVDGLSRRPPCPLLVMPHARRRAASRW